MSRNLVSVPSLLDYKFTIRLMNLLVTVFADVDKIRHVVLVKIPVLAFDVIIRAGRIALIV